MRGRFDALPAELALRPGRLNSTPALLIPNLTLLILIALTAHCNARPLRCIWLW